MFGTAAAGCLNNYEVMAAVMVGGMVPPIAIALSTTFCPKSGAPTSAATALSTMSWVSALSPRGRSLCGRRPAACAAQLHHRLGALASSLSMVFGCALRAPHGGIFVFPVVDHALLYVVALAVGSAVGALILSLLKKSTWKNKAQKPCKAAPAKGRPFGVP